MFAICICFFIGLAFGNLQRVEIGKDDMKANENARKAVSLDIRAAIKQDQYLRSNDVHTSVQCAAGSSNETVTSEKLSAAATPMTVTYGPSKEKRSERMTYLETHATDVQSLMKQSNQHLSGHNASTAVKGRFSRSIKTRSLYQKDYESVVEDPFGTFGMVQDIQRILSSRLKERVFASMRAEENLVQNLREHGRASPDILAKYKDALKAEWATLKEEVPSGSSEKLDAYRLLRSHAGVRFDAIHRRLLEFFEKPSAALTAYENFKREEYDSLDSVLEEISPHKAQKSYIAMKYLLNNLPSVLQEKILFTDESERTYLEKHGQNENVSLTTLNTYKLAKLDEREVLKRLLAEVPIILPTYKAIRKGVAWNYMKLDDKFKTFFEQPSGALTYYEGLKKDELASLDRFLANSNLDKAEEFTEDIEAKQSLKRKT